MLPVDEIAEGAKCEDLGKIVVVMTWRSFFKLELSCLLKGRKS